MGNSDSTGAVAGGCPRWAKIVLGVSVAANLVFVGMMANWATHNHGKRIEGLDRRQSRMVRILPESRQDEARDLLMASRAEMDAWRASMRTTQQRIVDTLRSSEFSGESLGEAFAERRRLMGEVYGLIHRDMLQVVEQMSPDERKQFADRLEQLSKRWEERNASR